MNPPNAVDSAAFPLDSTGNTPYINRMQFTPTETASGLPWKLRHDDARMATAIAQQHGVSELVAGIVAGAQYRTG